MPGPKFDSWGNTITNCVKYKNTSTILGQIKKTIRCPTMSNTEGTNRDGSIFIRLKTQTPTNYNQRIPIGEKTEWHKCFFKSRKLLFVSNFKLVIKAKKLCFFKTV